jgi:hypothetical protein
VRTTTSVRDYAWGSVAGVMLVLAVLNGVACCFALFRGDFLALIRVSGGLLFGYWMGVGAWRRTRWGRPAVHEPRPDPPLSAGHARALIALALGSAIVLALALAVQAVVGRS